MKHKNFLLITFFLTLFVFQQVQADATISLKENPSQVSFAPPYAPLSTIHVFVLALTPGNTIDYSITGQPYKCLYPYQYHGCGIIDPERADNPTYARNPVPINVEDFYLQDVVTIEMNVGEIPPTEQELPALTAQAIVARTVASWKAVNPGYTLGSEGGWGYINNSTQHQVFIPGSYNGFPSAQDLIDRAITETQEQFLSYEPDESYNGTRKTIDAEFSSDIIPQSAYGNQGYLQIVQEPISSSTCNIQGAIANDWGMSQRGAIRWAIGNTCPDESGTSWPVMWTDYRQILTHYYTGIDILDSTGGKVAPDDRWNLITHTLPIDANRVATVNAGGTLSFNITVQNTSAANFDWSDVVIGYKWNNGSWIVLANDVSSTSLVNPPNDPLVGNLAFDFPLSIPVPTDLPADSRIHLDLGHQIDSQTVHWFSAQSPAWPDATIDIDITGAIVTPTFTPIPVTSTPAPSECTSWNLANDFRISPNQENPNRDSCGSVIWEFLGSNSLVRDPANYYPMTIFTPSIGGYAGLDFWLGNYEDWLGRFPSIGFNGSGETRVFDGHITFPANAVDIHPGPSHLGIIAWHSPLSGYISISGGVNDNDSACGDGIVWYLDKNTTELASGSINANEQFFATGYGGAELSSVAVSSGDIIYLAIHPNGNYICDNTKVELFIDVTSAPTTATSTPINGPTSLPTSTIQPTPVDCWCPINFFVSILNICNQSTSSNKLAIPINALQVTQQAILDVQLFHRVEDEILSQTPQGQHYIDLYYANGFEIIELTKNNSELKDEAIATLQLWEPNLQALVDGQGNNTIITSGQVQAIETFLDHLYLVASPELRQTIDSERTSNPLEEVIGSTMNQASVNFIDYQVLPTSTTTPTLTATATPTPIIYSLSLQPNIANGMDTFLLSTMNTTNHGTYEVMGVGENNDAADKYARSLIKFDLSAIPSNAIVTSATLSLWTAQDLATNNSEVSVYRLKIPFSESSATWMRPVTGQNWQIAGASGANDRESTAIGTLLIPANMAVNTEQQILLSPAKVQGWISNTFINNGVILVASSELNDRFNYKTSDSTTTAQRPKLVIEYYIPFP